MDLMNWNKLDNMAQLDVIDQESQTQPVMILKHSTRCNISAMALARIERGWQPEDSQKQKPYYLDLLNHRDISNAIAGRYGVEHESPQVLIISQGKCIYAPSHNEISYQGITSTKA